MLRVITCRELIGFLDDHVAGALPESERAVFAAHLETCPACVRYLKGYQGGMRALALAHLPDAEAPPEVPEALVSAIRAARRLELRRD
jgi:anti-sigma factor RsiW